ncbi:hypothetical protein [Streptomyces sp. NPDC002671]
MVTGATRGMGPSEVQTAWVQCPAGYYATGGGANTSGGGVPGPFLSISVGTPRSDNASGASSPTGWFVEARNYSTTAPATITAYVICDQTYHYVREVTSESVPAGQVGYARAECPSSTTASGGGYFLSGDRAQFLATDSITNGSDWAAEGINYASEPGIMSAQVICSTATNIMRLGQLDKPSGHADGSSGAYCKPGETPVGGGQYVGDQVSLFASYPSSFGWDTRAYNGSDIPQHILAEVICRPTG